MLEGAFAASTVPSKEAWIGGGTPDESISAALRTVPVFGKDATFNLAMAPW